MMGVDVFAIAAAGLMAMGFYGFVAQPHPLRRILAINIFGNGVFMSMILIAHWLPNGPDTIPHAMVITGLVIAVSASAFGLALIRRQALNRRADAGRGDD